MSDEEIVAVYRGLDQTCGEMYPGLDGRETDGNVMQVLLDRLSLDVGGLAVRDWQRTENLVSTAMQSEDEITGCFAADVAAALIRTGTAYEFARGVLLTLAAGRGEGSSQAVNQVIRMSEEGVLTPEQDEDLSTRLEAIFES